MKLAIISDVHDNIANLDKCLSWCRANNIESLICCGDLTNSETLDFLANNFPGKINILMGNCDTYDESLVLGYKNLKYHDRKGGRLYYDNFKVGFCHEPYHIKHLFHIDKFDLIFYGHTHKPWESSENGVRLVNPGTLGGVFQKASFAVWDSGEDKLELKILELI
jgi:putative phosphoesterase